MAIFMSILIIFPQESFQTQGIDVWNHLRPHNLKNTPDDHIFTETTKEYSPQVGNWQLLHPVILSDRPSKRLKVRDLKPISSNRRQDSVVTGQIIYVNPSIFKESFGNLPPNNAGPYYTQRGESNTLEDLLNKNSNVQYESLQNFLQTAPQNSQYISALQKAKPFQIEDIMNRNSTQPVSAKDFKSLQQQLDEASSHHVSQALERAQEQARAHVEAQHKAIAEAQKAILQKVQDTFSQNPQALPLVQEVLPNNQMKDVRENALQPTSAPEQTNNLWKNSQESPVAPAKAVLLKLQKYNIVALESTSSKLNPLKEALISQKPIYHASNHVHESTAQQQARKMLINQVRSINKEILKGQKKTDESPKYVQSYRKKKITDSQEQPLATMYQEVVLNPQNHNDVASNLATEDIENEQYNSKYAFGYEIKDMEVGNDYGHEEKRDGKSAEGNYYVLLPDGRRQKVEYYADNSGYHAKVSYERI